MRIARSCVLLALAASACGSGAASDDGGAPGGGGAAPDAGLLFTAASCSASGCRACTHESDCPAGDACVAGACSACTSEAQCSPGEACVAGACGACHAASECAAGEGCHAGACGACAVANDCRATEACTAGTCTPCPADSCCIGTAVVATGALDPEQPCRSCQPLVTIHAYSARPDGNGCDDGDVCNGVTTCQSGACSQTTPPTTCGSPPACHSVMSATCAAGTGVCTYPPLPDGSGGCAGGQTCVGGGCVAKCVIGGTVWNAGAANPANACQTCQPGTSTSAWSNIGDGTACNDGNACTKNDKCIAGTCGGTAYTCTANACQQASTCNGSGGCTVVNKGNGVACPGGSCTAGCCVTGCGAPTPACGQTTSGTDNCGNACSLNGGACPDPCGGVCAANEYCFAGGCSVYPSCQPTGTICYTPYDCCNLRCNFNSCQP